MSNVLVSLSYSNIRALELARHILASQEAMGQKHGTLVDDLGDILGLARAERWHSTRVPAGDLDGLDPDDPRSTGWYERVVEQYDLYREGK